MLAGPIRPRAGRPAGCRQSATGDGMAVIEVKSEIAARVWKIEAGVGATVGEGDPVITLESMKMEIPVAAPASGRVSRVLVNEADAVKEGQVVALIEG